METKVPTTQEEQPVTPSVELLNEVKEVKDASITKDDDIVWMKSWILEQKKKGDAQYWVSYNNRSSGASTGSTTYTPGFRVKSIRATVNNETYAVTSIGSATSVASQACVCTLDSGVDGNIIQVYSGATRSAASVTEITETTFTITWTIHTINTFNLIEAFG